VSVSTPVFVGAVVREGTSISRLFHDRGEINAVVRNPFLGRRMRTSKSRATWRKSLLTADTITAAA